MKNNFVDRLLEKIDKQNIIRLFNEGSNGKEISEELGMSKVWVEEVVNEHNKSFIDVGDAYAEEQMGRDQENFAELHGAEQSEDGSWVM